MDRETGSDQEEHAPTEHDNSEEYDNSKECQENTLLKTHSQMLGKFEYTLPAKF